MSTKRWYISEVPGSLKGRKQHKNKAWIRYMAVLPIHFVWTMSKCYGQETSTATRETGRAETNTSGAQSPLCQGRGGTNSPRCPWPAPPGAAPTPVPGPGPPACPHGPLWPRQGCIWPRLPSPGLILSPPHGLTSCHGLSPSPSQWRCLMPGAGGWGTPPQLPARREHRPLQCPNTVLLAPYHLLQSSCYIFL